jgi:hypothetical protein
VLDCLNEVQHMEERVKRLEQSIVEVIQLTPVPMQDVVRGLQALRISRQSRTPCQDAGRNWF